MKKNDILFLLVCTCIVVFAWILFTVIHTSATSTITETLSQAILPIKPDFDTRIIEQLKTREIVTPIYTFGQASLSGSLNSHNTVSPAIITTQPTQSTNSAVISPLPSIKQSSSSAILQP